MKISKYEFEVINEKLDTIILAALSINSFDWQTDFIVSKAETLKGIIAKGINTNNDFVQ